MLGDQSDVMLRSFTCRQRTMHNLTEAESRLAHQGTIAPELRSRSPVHYWQTHKQPWAQYEAICSKAHSWHVLTFGSHGKYQKLASLKCSGAANRFRRNGQLVLDSCQNLTLSSLSPDWAAAHGVSLTSAGDLSKPTSRGAGFWVWKPYSILRRLEQLKMGDVLAWIDYDLILPQDLTALFCLAQNAGSGIAVFHFPCLTDRAWTKRGDVSDPSPSKLNQAATELWFRM
jgi:hypothetical protein